jgi:hypothetical protein
MSIQDWGAIGELIGALAVVISLIYLAVQIRQNTRQISQTFELNRLASFERTVEAGNHIRELLILNPELAALFEKGIRRFDELDKIEKIRFDFLLRNMFSGFQGAFARHQIIGHDPERFEGTQRLMDSLLINRGVLSWLDFSEKDWSPEFAELVRGRAQLARDMRASRK